MKHADIEDVEEIYDIMKGIGRIAYTRDLVADLINSESSICLKLILDEKIIGALGEKAEGENALWLYFVVVKEEFRKKDYATKLMNRLFEEAKNIGIKRIALDTPDREFSEKFGFKEAGKIPNWYKGKDQIIMYRFL